MKKLLAIFLILSILLFTTSCQFMDFADKLFGSLDNTEETPDDTPDYKEMTPEDYDELNSLLTKVDDTITIARVSENLGATLRAEYVVSPDSVRYTVEQLNKLPEDADINKLPSSMVSTYSGVATKNENGVLVTEDGEEIALPEGELSKGAFHFDESNFKEGKRYDTGFEGEVLSVSALLGVETSITSMYVRVTYNDASISAIVLTYTSGSANVTVTYTF